MKADMLNLMVLSLRLLLSTRNTTLDLDIHDTGKREERNRLPPPTVPADRPNQHNYLIEVCPYTKRIGQPVLHECLIASKSVGYLHVPFECILSQMGRKDTLRVELSSDGRAALRARTGYAFLLDLTV